MGLLFVIAKSGDAAVRSQLVDHGVTAAVVLAMTRFAGDPFPSLGAMLDALDALALAGEGMLIEKSPTARYADACTLPPNITIRFWKVAVQP